MSNGSGKAKVARGRAGKRETKNGAKGPSVGAKPLIAIVVMNAVASREFFI